MIEADDPESTEDKRLCIQCIGDEFLAAEVLRTGQPAVCGYCGKTDKTETISELADRFHGVFEEHYERAGEVGWENERGDPVDYLIADIGRLPEAAASDIQEVMAERHEDRGLSEMGDKSPYDAELTYVESNVDTREFEEAWENLEADLRSRHRFFSREAEEVFSRVFADLHTQKTWEGRPVIRTVGPGSDITALYRARAFQSEARFDEAMIDPEQYVGTPASIYAQAGRMNPKGVPFFYGATKEKLALTEVRPPVASKLLVGRFDLQRELHVLDVEALENVLERGSLFDPGFSQRLARAKFLGRLARRIRMPVLPDDEATDYLITQVMADFLAMRMAPEIHGVIYGSAQGTTDAFNVALFNASSRVRAAEVVKNASYEVRYSGNDEEIDACVVTTTINPSPPEPPKPAGRGVIFEYVPPDPAASDLRPETLVLDRGSLRLHRVKEICVDTDTLSIYRFTHEDSEADTPF